MEITKENRDLGFRFRKVRKEINLTQKEIASIMEVSQGTITDLERGRMKLSKKNAQKLSEKLGINTGWLNTGEGGMFSKNIQGINTGNNTGFADFIGSIDNKAVEEIIENSPFNNAMLLHEFVYQLDRFPTLKKIDENITSLLRLRRIMDYLKIAYVDPLIDFKWRNDEVNYKEFVNKYLEKLMSYKRYASALEKLSNAANKFYKEMYDAGDTYFEIFDENYLTEQLQEFEEQSNKIKQDTGDKDVK
ncbi:MAG: hypothetical protein DI598_15275 [Pseudopedobacter saltans]|uniref:HTH cro/C1-type domain-containing protein n=1 Tax=Pseudopedobacter saltans TaxID=151895 RepID=A0A2W5GP77_9SPHI|nr:MAG: hypothetical protein DI598_15275 [Pseudopedobacter saltans]